MFSINKRNSQIPIAKKLEYIEYSKIHGKNAAAKYAGVSTKSIRNWINNEYRFRLIPNPKKKITIHHGLFKSKIDYEVEKEIYNWIDFNRSLGNVVTTWSTGVEFIKRYPDYLNIKPHSLLQALYRFMNKYNLSIRTASHEDSKFQKIQKILYILF